MYKSHYLLRDFHPQEPLQTHTLTPADCGCCWLCFHSAHGIPQAGGNGEQGFVLCLSLVPWVSTSSTGKTPARQCCSHSFTHLLSLTAGKHFTTSGFWVWIFVKLKVQGQRFECNEAEAGLGCPEGAGEHLVMGTKLPCCCSLVSMPAPSFADAATLLPGACHLLKSAADATSGDMAVDLYPQLQFFPGVNHHTWSCQPGRTHRAGPGRSACLISSLHLLRFEAS